MKQRETTLPLYDNANGCYRLFKTEVKTRQIKLQSSDVLKYWFAIYFNKAEAYKLLGEMVADNNFTLTVDWTGAEEELTKVFSQNTLKAFAEAAYKQMQETDNAKMTKTLTQLVNNVDSLSVGDAVISEAAVSAKIGVTITEAEQTYTIS